VTRLVPVNAKVAGSLDPAELRGATYLTVEQAARYVGYAPDRYPHPEKAFMKWVDRCGSLRLPKCYRGRKVLFRRADLDRVVAFVPANVDRALGRPS
jgi:hypothetical protein